MNRYDTTHEHHHHDIGSNNIAVEQRAICPVTGDTVDIQVVKDRGWVRLYASQTYYFCCDMCVDLFDKNPERYAKQKEEHGILMLRLKEKQHLTNNVWAFRFEPAQALDWIAGQFVRVELPHDNPDDEGTKRWFTVSSAPYEGIVQITTRITDSTFKQALSALSIGGELHLIEKPNGDFIWEDSSRPLVFVAGGIGITPFRSILRQRAHDNQPLNVTLVYANRTPAIPFKDEFDSYAAKDEEFAVTYPTGASLDVAKLKELVPTLMGSKVYVSGAEPMVEVLGNELKAAGLPESYLKQDFFPNYTTKNY